MTPTGINNIEYKWKQNLSCWGLKLIKTEGGEGKRGKLVKKQQQGLSSISVLVLLIAKLPLFMAEQISEIWKKLDVKAN